MALTVSPTGKSGCSEGKKKMQLEPNDFRMCLYGEPVAILGNGPSLINVPVMRLKMTTIGVNRSWKLIGSPYHCIVDPIFVDEINQCTWKPAGTLFSWSKYDVSCPDVEWVKMHPKPSGWPIKPEGSLYASSYSGPCATELALWMGANPIYLCGFDSIDRGGNFDEKRVSHVYGEQRDYMPELKKRLPEGVEIFNATPGSAIECFPFVDPKELGFRS